MQLDIGLKGSLQNPTVSPDLEWLLITVWHDAYNEGNADLARIKLNDQRHAFLVTCDVSLKDRVNVSQPGLNSCWHPSGRIIFSSTKPGNDWPCTVAPDGTGLTVLPGYSEDLAGYEPTLAPNGVDFAFEQHDAGDENNGSIVAFIGGKKVTLAGPDSRQPAWSPVDNAVVYQHHAGGKWNLWVVHFNAAGDITGRFQITHGDEFTDATWNPRGDQVLCSADGGLYGVTPGAEPRLIVPTTKPVRYLGAPSYSPDGTFIVAEASDKDDPDGTSGTWIELIKV